MDVFFVMLVKPFFVMGFLLLAWLIAKLLWYVIPAGRVKQVLYSPLPWYRARRGRSVAAQQHRR